MVYPCRLKRLRELRKPPFRRPLRLLLKMQLRMLLLRIPSWLPTAIPHLKDQELLKRVQGIFKPLPRAEEMQELRLFTEERVKLGHQLWYEPRLSKGDTVSCNSRHNLASAGVGNQGHKGQLGGRNSPRPL